MVATGGPMVLYVPRIYEYLSGTLLVGLMYKMKIIEIREMPPLVRHGKGKKKSEKIK